jgi:hypothetical protein
MRGLVTLPASASVADVCAVLDADGGVIVEDMVSQEVMDALWQDLEPYLDQTPFGEEGFSGPLTRRCCALMAKSLHAAAFLTQPHFYGAAKYFLEEEYKFLLAAQQLTTTSSVQLSVTQAIQIWPGEKEQVAAPGRPSAPPAPPRAGQPDSNPGRRLRLYRGKRRHPRDPRQPFMG